MSNIALRTQSICLHGPTDMSQNRADKARYCVARPARKIGRDNIKEGVAEVTQTPPQYDLVVLADKDAQVELDGATLNAEDLRGHIRYRNETGHPVHTILLKKGEKQKVTEQHILVVAGIARDLKAEGFVELNDGKLKRLIVNDSK